MTTSRREFIAIGSIGLLANALPAQAPDTQTPNQTPGAPPAFGTAPAMGPEVSEATFKEAEKLVQVEMTEKDLEQAAGNWRISMASMYERRTGPRKVALEETLAPATQWNPSLPGTVSVMPAEDRFVRSADARAPLPNDEAAIAYAPVAQLSRWIESRAITSERLTEIYLRRLERFNPQLHCVITLVREQALAQARKADAEIAGGRYRGPLHGIPWGAKDLLDSAGIATTYGAEPFRNRVPAKNGAVAQRLEDAGAVLVAKLSLGALALNDIWFGGQTRIRGFWKRAPRDRARGRVRPRRLAWSRFRLAVRPRAALRAPRCAAA